MNDTEKKSADNPAKTTTAESLALLQAQAEAAFEAASLKASQLPDAAEETYDELKAEAIEQLEVAQAKLDELRTEAADQIAERNVPTRGFFSRLFGKK